MPESDTDTSGRWPPTVLVIHPKERRSKCTVEHLRGRSEFVFVRFPDKVPIPLDGYIRLGLNAPELTVDDANSGLLLLDGTWKLASRMEPFYAELPVRSLPPTRTAYPRVSRIYDDPPAGLATIEALYAALKILQRPVNTLLGSYHWQEEFLGLNGWSAE